MVRAQGKRALDHFPASLAGRLIGALLTRELQLFQAFRGSVGPDDLEQECLIAMRRAWPKYSATKGEQSTFLTHVAWRRLQTIYRGLMRNSIREAKIAPRADQHEPASEHDPENLADWLGNVHRTMRLFYLRGDIPLRPARARKSHPDRAQRAALLLLKRRMQISSRGLALVLECRPDLCAAVRLAKPLKYRAIAELEKSVQHIAKPVAERGCVAAANNAA